MPQYALGDLEPRLHPTAFVHPDAVVIGAVEIGEEASVWPGAVLRGDAGSITVGAGTSIQDGTVVHTSRRSVTRIGAGCVVGHNAYLEGCTVEDGALIGSMAAVYHGVIVRTGALVGMGAVVVRGTEVPTGFQALGVPARISEAAGDIAAEVRRGAETYRALAGHYRRHLRLIG
jgi:carbonic anhydrase/acetyltransferase-like protein (isoleucine patch superfamily)